MRTKIIVALVFSVGCVVSSDGYADERIVPAWLHEVKLGVLYHDSGDLWSRLRRESGVDLNLEAIFSPQFGILGGTIRPAFGGSFNTAGDTSRLYTGLRWQYEHASGMFFSIGLGGAIHNGKLDLQSNDRKALGSRVLFHIPIEAGYRFNVKHALSIYFDHMSNGYLAHANEGMDTLGARYGYRF
ncbi:MAG: acyloxyacyl hydrolase [Nitrosospira sp.]|nr:acyloxyacyl hydrolase [Nitrosospira sp.]